MKSFILEQPKRTDFEQPKTFGYEEPKSFNVEQPKSNEQPKSIKIN